MNKIFWHNLPVAEVIKKLKSDKKNGLSERQIKERQESFGLNKFSEEKPISHFKIFLEQFQSPLIYILIVAGIITLVLKEFTDSMAIFVVVFLNAIIGYFQESKASKALRELKKVIKVQTKVIRGDNEIMIDSSQLVPGDIVVLTAGDKVPADGRLIESYHLRINEAHLTGEWISAEKVTKSLSEETPMADRDNMVYMGCVIEEGRGKIVITEIGSVTEIGKIAIQVQKSEDKKTPLQKKLDYFSKVIGVIVVVVCSFILVTGMLMGKPFLEIFTVSIALAVAAIPEGLPMAMTTILTIGIQRILKKKGLIRRLLAVETLGSTSVIATDKTLTLTEGKMQVDNIVASDEKLALKIITLVNEAFVENPKEKMEKWIVQGRPTDKAMLLAGAESAIFREELEKQESEIDEISFEPVHKYAARLYKDKKTTQKNLYVCGAPEKIIKLSSFLKTTKKQEALNSQKIKQLESELENLTKNGFRVLAVAYRECPKTKRYKKLKEICKDLVFVGFIALKDPLRKEVKGAMEICQQAGMKPIIITGDHKLTAKAIAEELGLKINRENIIEGNELDKMSDEELKKKVKNIIIYARAEPCHKMRIVEAWQERGAVVAMTGDGINDAPALKKADIGVAVGSGTDVAKEVADLVLLPDCFNIIVAAVEEGRLIIDNLRKVITYLLSTTIAAVIIIVVTLPLGLPLPISATQILWINLLGGTVPAFALGMEQKEKNIMKRKPENKNIPLMTKESKIVVVIIGFFASSILLLLFIWLYRSVGIENIYYIRTMIFACLALQTIFYIFSCRNLKKSLWQISPFSNKYIIAACSFVLFMLFLAVYFPPLQTILRTTPLLFQDWIILLGLGVISLVLIEITKFAIQKVDFKEKIG